MKPPKLLSLALGLAILMTGQRALASGSWEEVADELGIKVWRQALQNTSLVKFRAYTRIEKPLVDIVAVVYDHERRHLWLQRTAKHRVIRRVSPERAILYSQLPSSWPLVSHRDAVVDAQMWVQKEKNQVMMHFTRTEVASVPPVEGFVRMPDLEGTWIFRPLSPTSTDVFYEGYGDPGGWIPHWVVNRIAKNTPLMTLHKLRRYAGNVLFADTLLYVRDNFDWSWLPQ